jgi:restriction system protein
VAAVAIPDFQSLMLPVLRHFAERQWSTAELTTALSDEYGLTADERRQLLPSGTQTTITNRTHWAVGYLNRAGLISRVARGQYVATEDGRKVLAAPPDRITIGFLNQFPAFDGFRRKLQAEEGFAPSSISSAADSGVPAATPEERLGAVDRELKADLAETLLGRLRAISPSAFEQFIVDLLVAIGYGGTHREAAERLGRSGDGGVDGVIREDKLGLGMIYIQAKRYAEDNSVGAPAIQGFAGALLSNGATKGVFVTTSRFTSQARDMTSTYKTHRIVLIDGPELARLMIEHDIGVRAVQTVKLQRVDLEAYEEDAAS